MHDLARHPHVYRAPGRVNLIGEHTDYNDGFAMPAAIEFYCWVAVGAREDRKLSIYSEEFSAAAEADLSSAALQPSKTWSDYPVGVALQLEQAGFRLRGANLLIESEVPMGAGLSSSAAIEVATALALADQSGWSAGPRPIGAALPKSGKRIRRRACRHYGPVRFLARTRGPRADARLPRAEL